MKSCARKVNNEKGTQGNFVLFFDAVDDRIACGPLALERLLK